MKQPLPSRRFILFSGEHAWAIKQAETFCETSLLANKQIIWHPRKTSAQRNKMDTHSGNALKYLGTDKAIVIIDAYHGLNPNIFGRLSGTIVAGGAMVVLCPPFSKWPSYADPEIAKMSPYLHALKNTGNRYIARWTKIIQRHKWLELFQQNDSAQSALPALPIAACKNHSTSQITATTEQNAAIKSIVKSYLPSAKHKPCPMIIRADRGRGKSALLGMAAQALFDAERDLKIIVTASGTAQTKNLFKHAASDARKGAHLRYVAADALIKAPKACDLLMVDEAAALGLHRLNALLKIYPKILFASTEHGYEGSGRGFTLKFNQLVQQAHPLIQTKIIKLIHPIRWADNDPLEACTNQLLLLDAKIMENSHALPRADKVGISSISQNALLNDEALLQKIFALLSLAHYQTRPVDLRFLLDAPNTELRIAKQDNDIIGLCWAVNEGGIDQAMAMNITAGRRRPQGHLAPQILAAHLGLPDAASLHCTRVQRIVVHPAWQQLGIGSQLLAALKQGLNKQTDYLASSFGADIKLLSFWQKAAYQVVRLGDKASAENGLLPALVMQATSTAGLALIKAARLRFKSQFAAQCAAGWLKQNAALKDFIGAAPTLSNTIEPHELEAAALFAFAHRPFESTRGALMKLATSAENKPKNNRLNARQNQLVNLAIMQNKNWKDCAKLTGHSGKNECIAALRASIGTLLTSLLSAQELSALKEKFTI